MTKEVALITGSTSGMGAATAELFATHDYHVVVTGTNRDKGQAVCDGIANAGHTADFFQADLTHELEAEDLVAYAARLGKLTMLVNCVGGNKPGMSRQQHFALNYDAPRFVTEAALPYMKAGACIITVTSICAESPRRHGDSTYADAKAALTAYVHGKLPVVTPKKIRMNIVAPGLTNTADTAHLTQKERRVLRKEMPLTQAFLTPAQIAQIVYGLSEWKCVTGATIVADGGMIATYG